jgi:hypothetical protein
MTAFCFPAREQKNLGSCSAITGLVQSNTHLNYFRIIPYTAHQRIVFPAAAFA